MTSRRLLSIVLVLLLGSTAIAVAFLLDAPVEKAILTANGGHWHREPLIRAVSRYGDWPELMLLGGAGYLLARRLGNIRWQRLLLSAMIASTLAGMAVNMSRLTTGRTRPKTAASQGWYGPRHDGQWLIGKGDFNSFPSGHTATAVGFAGVIIFGAPAWGVAVTALAMTIAFSRILLGAHHPSDVVTATVIALIVAWSVWEYLGKRGRLDYRKKI